MPHELALTPDQAHKAFSEGSRSFSFAAKWLPADRRVDVARLYAFCRLADDLVDEAPSVEAGREGLLRLERQLLRTEPPDAVTAGILALVDSGRLRLPHALELVRGVGTDLDEVRIADERALLRYSYGVASTVGLMMCDLLDIADPEARAFAIDLGVAMQLTNIARDVAEDARRGRVYLPASWCEEAGVRPTPQGVLVDPERTGIVVQRLLERADVYYASGARGLRFLPLRARVAVSVARRVYRAIGEVLRRRDFDVTRGRAVVDFATKVLEACTGLVYALWCPFVERSHDAQLHRELVGLPGAHTVGMDAA